MALDSHSTRGSEVTVVLIFFSQCTEYCCNENQYRVHVNIQNIVTDSTMLFVAYAA